MDLKVWLPRPANSISITQEFVRNAVSQAPLQACASEPLRVRGPTLSLFNKSSGGF